MKKKLYISAPISGGEPKERRKFFDGVAREAAERGWQPINPMDNEHEKWGMPIACDSLKFNSTKHGNND